jgi:hypothetical protein
VLGLPKQHAIVVRAGNVLGAFQLMRRFVLVAAVLGALVPLSAHAQTTHCTTQQYFSNWYDTTCSSSADYTNALIQLYVLAAEQQYLQSLANQPPPVVDPGVTINLDTGGTRYLPRGTFVRIGQAPAIYWVYGAQLHPFSAWQQFLNDGGQPDLSNVVQFAYLRDYGGLFGAPVP